MSAPVAPGNGPVIAVALLGIAALIVVAAGVEDQRGRRPGVPDPAPAPVFPLPPPWLPGLVPDDGPEGVQRHTTVPVAEWADRAEGVDAVGGAEAGAGG